MLADTNESGYVWTEPVRQVSSEDPFLSGQHLVLVVLRFKPFEIFPTQTVYFTLTFD